MSAAPTRDELAALTARWAQGEAMLAAANAASTGPGAVVEETTTAAEFEQRWQDERALHRDTRDAAMKAAAAARAVAVDARGLVAAGLAALNGGETGDARRLLTAAHQRLDALAGP